MVDQPAADLFLPSRGHFLHDGRIPAQLLLAEDDHVAGTLPVGRLHLPLHLPVEHIPLRRTSRPAQFGEQRDGPLPGLFTQGHHVTVQPAPDGELNPLILQGDENPVQSQGKADARDIPAADLLHQSVVPAAPAEGSGLGPQPLQDIFEGGLGVIVQPPHQSGVDPVIDPQQVQGLFHRLEVGAAFIAQEIGDLRRLRGDLPAAFVLAVQHAQGIAIQPGLAIPAQLLPPGRQESHQFFPVNGRQATAPRC